MTNEIAVAALNLDHVEAGLLCNPSRIAKRFDNLPDFFNLQLGRGSFARPWPLNGHSGRCDHWIPDDSLTPSMVNLYSRFGSIVLNDPGQISQTFKDTVVIYPKLAMRSLACFLR